MTYTSTQQQPSLASTSLDNDNIAPPSSADKFQLEMWRRIFSHRVQQIQALSSANFLFYVNVIALDIQTSRWCNDRQVDLVTGYYASNVLDRCPPPTNVTVSDVGRHLVALFYRSVDDRLTCIERKFGLDAVKSAFAALDRLKDGDTSSYNAATDQFCGTNDSIDTSEETHKESQGGSESQGTTDLSSSAGGANEGRKVQSIQQQRGEEGNTSKKRNRVVEPAVASTKMMRLQAAHAQYQQEQLAQMRMLAQQQQQHQATAVAQPGGASIAAANQDQPSTDGERTEVKKVTQAERYG